jgi:hypothetical protein
MTALPKSPAALLACLLTLGFAAEAAGAPMYTLVQGLDNFKGSATAWHLLETNGFVVADPTYKQIFEPYLDESMPVYITPDSAWHAYHVLLEEGMLDLETAQSRRLTDYSRRLWSSANEQAKSAGADFSDLARFAGIGLAFQDETFRNSLPDDQKRLVESLLAGKGEVKMNIGFPLWAPAFQSGGQEPGSAWPGYVAARQWYALVDFRLMDERETGLALELSWLIHKDADLLQLWHQLSDPWDALLGPPADGNVTLYWEAAEKKLGADFTPATLLKNVAVLRPNLEELVTPPRVDDQRLKTDEAAHFADVIKGFRLLPPRHRQSEASFQQIGGRQIPPGKSPSALNFFVASTALRSPAAERAFKAAEDGAEVSNSGQLPDSLSGKALRLLATLQEPLPEGVAPVLRTEAWADAQLWAQMAEWTEEEHLVPARRTVWVEEGAIVKPSAGVVAPYPKFFEGLSKLALETAATLEKAGIDEPFDSKTAARKLLEGILWQEGLAVRNQEESDHPASLIEQFTQFWQRSLETHQTELEKNPPAAQKLMNDLETLARRTSTQTAPAQSDRDVLMHFFQERQTAPKLLRDFAPFCDKLANLARKHLEATALTEDETTWMAEYGTALAHFQCYSGTSSDVVRDDFPIVNRVQISPGSDASLYAGLGRPQAFYVILPCDGKLRLFRGAVMTYREFVRTNASAEALDDSTWRAVARTGEIPPPPAFARTFQAERDAAELIKSFASINGEIDYKEMSEALEELQSRVTDRDVPELIAALDRSVGEQPGSAVEGIAAALAKLHWEPHQQELLALLEKNDGLEIPVITPILLERTKSLDVDFLSTNMEHVPPLARCVYCTLLSRLPPTAQTRGTLRRALSDASPAVRLQAATALGADAADVSEKVAALLRLLNDDNEYVTAAAASALGQLKATNAAPALLTNLQERLQKPEPSPESLRPQSEAVQNLGLIPIGNQPRRGRGNGQPRVVAGMPMRRFAGGFPMREEGSPARNALIEALGDLHYQPAEEPIFGLLDGLHAMSAGKALKQLAPEKLARRLEAEACDNKADPQARDRALLLLAIPPANSSATGLIPLLDDKTIVPVPARRGAPGREWRICDQAATTIATLLGRSVKIGPMQPTDQRDQQIEQIRESLKAAY